MFWVCLCLLCLCSEHDPIFVSMLKVCFYLSYSYSEHVSACGVCASKLFLFVMTEFWTCYCLDQMCSGHASVCSVCFLNMFLIVVLAMLLFLTAMFWTCFGWYHLYSDNVSVCRFGNVSICRSCVLDMFPFVMLVFCFRLYWLCSICPKEPMDNNERKLPNLQFIGPPPCKQ
jgi:hypothetical protein